VIEIAKRLPEEGHLDPVAPNPEEFARMREFVQPVAEGWMARTEGGRETFTAAQEILADLRRRERQM